MTEERKAIISDRLERADEALTEAKIMLEHRHGNAAVNRLYYACFYVVSALLLTRGLHSSKHSGVRSLFNRYWVKTGLISGRLADIYNWLFDHRQKGDYGDFVRFQPDEVTPWVDEAKAFIEAVKGLIYRSGEEE